MANRPAGPAGNRENPRSDRALSRAQQFDPDGSAARPLSTARAVPPRVNGQLPIEAALQQQSRPGIRQRIVAAAGCGGREPWKFDAAETKRTVVARAEPDPKVDAGVWPVTADSHGLLDFEALVGEHDLFHGDIRALGVERPAGVLDDPRTKQFPGHDRRGMVLGLQRDRDRAQRRLVTIADVVEPLVKIQRTDDSAAATSRRRPCSGR